MATCYLGAWLHAIWLHATQVHATWVHATWVHAAWVHAAWVHAIWLHATRVHATRVHATWVHAAWVHAAWCPTTSTTTAWVCGCVHVKRFLETEPTRPHAERPERRTPSPCGRCGTRASLTTPPPSEPFSTRPSPRVSAAPRGGGGFPWLPAVRCRA